LLHKFKFLT